MTFTFAISILFGSALIGILAGRFLDDKVKPSAFHNILAISGAYLLTLTFIHIIPEMLELAGVFKTQLIDHHHHGHHHHHDHGGGGQASKAGMVMLLIVLVLGGFFLQQGLEIFTKGVDHGHVVENDVKIHPGLLVMSLSIHSFLEGSVILVDTDVASAMHVNEIMAGIVVHKVPAAFVLSALVFRRKLNVFTTLTMLAVFASASPIGCWVGNMVGAEEAGGTGTPLLLAVVTGNFLHIAGAIIKEAFPKRDFAPIRIVYVVIGVILAGLGNLIF